MGEKLGNIILLHPATLFSIHPAPAGFSPVPGLFCRAVYSFWPKTERGIFMSEAKAKYLAAKAAFEETFEKHLQNGVEFISDQVFIDPEVEIAPGAVILPGCILRGKTVIGANCVIGPNTLLENTIVEAGSTVNASQCYDSHLGPNNKIGPFTHVRTGTVTMRACTWALMWKPRTPTLPRATLSAT